MEIKAKKSINYYIRALHRDIGFFLIGLTIIYSLSGILLIYRDTGFLKNERQIEKKMSPDLEVSELGRIVHIRNLEITRTAGNVIYFQNGSYDKSSGIVKYSERVLPSFLEKFNNLHKKSSRDLTYVFSTIFAILLLFLAVSSFWMYKIESRMFRRGLVLAGSGIVVTLILLFL